MRFVKWMDVLTIYCFINGNLKCTKDALGYNVKIMKDRKVTYWPGNC